MSMNDKIAHHIGQTARIRRRLVGGSLDSLVRCVQISDQLKGNLAVFKRLHGDRWSELMADMGTALQLQMKATGETNPIAAAIPVAKAMSLDNQNPMLLLAVATDLAQAQNNEVRGTSRIQA